MSKSDVSPPGWSGTTEAMKKHSEIDNPFALAWSMYNQGDTPHKDDEGEEDLLDADPVGAARAGMTGHTGMMGTYGQPRGSEAPTTPALEAARDNRPYDDETGTDALDAVLGKEDAARVRDMYEADAKEECADAGNVDETKFEKDSGFPAENSGSGEPHVRQFEKDGASVDVAMPPDKAPEIQREQPAEQAAVNEAITDGPQPMPSEPVSAKTPVGTIGGRVVYDDGSMEQDPDEIEE